MPFDFLSLLSSADVPETRKAGEIIFEMGEPGRLMYIIKTGYAQIRIGDTVFDTIEKGGFIGEMALLDDDVRSAGAFALTDCEIVPIDKRRLLELLREEPLVAVEMAKVLVRRLRTTNFLVHHDALTRLPNRALFQERCRFAIMRAQRRATTIGILFIDLDHFKTVNESLGYAAGNQMLNAVATRLRSPLHELDTLARLGADKFAVLLEDITSGHTLAETSQRLLDALSNPFVVSGQNRYLSASVGISCYPQDGEDDETLLKNADSAMHRAKQQGGNSYCFFSAELNALALEALTLQNYLRQALDRGEFLLNYQPRVDIASGRITGVEALIRWQHPKLGLIPPTKFIPIAEQTGMIDAIGEWVLRTGCAQQKTWLASALPRFRIAINLSVRQLRRPDLKQRIAAILDETGLDASCLELEITESAVMEDPTRTGYVLKEIRSMGIAIALDDFGTEYSSLGYLKQFPFDYLKIDQSFVHGLPGDPDAVAITKAVIVLAKNLHLKVVAEGVESEQQLTFLKEHGCEEYLGYLFSRPLPVDAMETLLHRNLSGKSR